MIIRVLIGLLLGGSLGAIMGHVGRCQSGACPLTANPFRGAIYGAVMGTLFALSAGSASRSRPEAACCPTESLNAIPEHAVVTLPAGTNGSAMEAERTSIPAVR